MSTNYVKITQAIKQIQSLKEATSDGVQNEYQRGFYNGLEYALSVMQNRQSNFMRCPKQKILGELLDQMSQEYLSEGKIENLLPIFSTIKGVIRE